MAKDLNLIMFQILLTTADGIFFAELIINLFLEEFYSFADRYPDGLAANSDVQKYVTQQIARDVSKDLNTATQAGADSKIGVVKYFVFDRFLRCD